MTQDVKPTRSELLKIKKQIKLAQSGHKLLKKKRDGLIMEFFTLYKKAKSLRQELIELFTDAEEKVNIARVIESDLKISSIALAIENSASMEITNKNIMGVSVLNIEPPQVRKDILKRGFGVFNSPSIIEASSSYEKLVEKIIAIAEFETSLKKLLAEIEKTKRRVNALEFKTIPALTNVQGFIRLRLEEMERENIFRMKKIKAAT